VVKVKQISVSLRYSCSPLSHAPFTMATVRSAKSAFLKHFLLCPFLKKNNYQGSDLAHLHWTCSSRFIHSKRKAQNNETGHSTANQINKNTHSYGDSSLLCLKYQIKPTSNPRDTTYILKQVYKTARYFGYNKWPSAVHITKKNFELTN